MRAWILYKFNVVHLSHHLYDPLQSKFVDDDNVTHMEWNWSFDIKKDW